MLVIAASRNLDLQLSLSPAKDGPHRSCYRSSALRQEANLLEVSHTITAIGGSLTVVLDRHVPRLDGHV